MKSSFGSQKVKRYINIKNPSFLIFNLEKMTKFVN